MRKDPAIKEVRRRMDRNQLDRLSGLLAEFVQEHGPIDPQMMEEARQEWLEPKRRTPERAFLAETTEILLLR
jgi:hypothetical protein